MSDLVELIFITLDDRGEEIDKSYLHSLVLLQAVCHNVPQRKQPVCSSPFGSKATQAVLWVFFCNYGY